MGFSSSEKGATGDSNATMHFPAVSILITEANECIDASHNQTGPPTQRRGMLTMKDGAMGKPLKAIYQGESHRKSGPNDNTSRSTHKGSKCSCHRAHQLLVLLAWGSPVGLSCAPVPAPTFKLWAITSGAPSADGSRFVRLVCGCATGVGCESAIDPTGRYLANFVKE